MDTPITISDGKPARQTNHLTIGTLIFPRMDQIDFTGPFEVLSRIPDSTIHVIAKTSFPVRDIQGLSPEMTIAEAPDFDVLLVPGGFGQQQLMNDEEVLSLIRRHFADSCSQFVPELLTRFGFSGCRDCGTMPVDRKRFSSCPIEWTLSVLSEGWKGAVVWNLFSGSKRYSDLLRLASGVSHHD